MENQKFITTPEHEPLHDETDNVGVSSANPVDISQNVPPANNKNRRVNRLEWISIVILFIIISLIATYLLLPKNSLQLHSRNAHRAVAAATETKKLVSQISFSSNTIVNSGTDLGCTIQDSNQIFGTTNHDSCDYIYSVFKIGNRSMQHDIETLNSRLQAAGWSLANSDADASQSRYTTFQSDPTYYGAFPLDYQRVNQTKATKDVVLNLILISSTPNDSINSGINGKFYTALAKKYLKESNYIYGYSIDKTYYLSDCLKFICQNDPASN